MDRCESGTELHQKQLSTFLKMSISTYIWLLFTTECNLRPDAFRDIGSRSRQLASKPFLRTANENQLYLFLCVRHRNSGERSLFSFKPDPKQKSSHI